MHTTIAKQITLAPDRTYTLQDMGIPKASSHQEVIIYINMESVSSHRMNKNNDPYDTPDNPVTFAGSATACIDHLHSLVS